MTTIYGNDTRSIAPYPEESQFGTSSSSAQSLAPIDYFVLTEETDFITMSSAVRLNGGGSGTCRFVLLERSGATLGDVHAIVDNVPVAAAADKTAIVLSVVDVSKMPNFQRVPAGEYALAVNADGAGVRMGATDATNEYSLSSNELSVKGDTWAQMQSNNGRLVIFIEGVPTGAIYDTPNMMEAPLFTFTSV